MKLQACKFKKIKDGDEQLGVACVVDFDVEDIHWIIDDKGQKFPIVWSYTLLSQVLHVTQETNERRKQCHVMHMKE